MLDPFLGEQQASTVTECSCLRSRDSEVPAHETETYNKTCNKAGDILEKDKLLSVC